MRNLCMSYMLLIDSAAKSSSLIAECAVEDCFPRRHTLWDFRPVLQRVFYNRMLDLLIQVIR